MLGLNTIQITPEIMRRACDIDAFKGTWSALEKHTTGLNLLSEFAQHGQSFRVVLEQLKDHPISTKNIRALYAAMISTDKSNAYKTADNQITIVNAGGATTAPLDTAPPEQVEPLLEKLTEWVNTALEDDTLHPLITIAVFTAIFLQIGPFPQGNQRLAYLWAQILMLKSGYSYAPFSSLEESFQDNALDYSNSLKHNQDSLEQGRPDWSAWLRTFLTVLQHHKNILDQKLNAPDKDLSHLPTLSARILRLFDNHDRLQMKQIITMTNGRRATIKLRLSEMLDEGYVRRHGSGRSTWYSLV